MTVPPIGSLLGAQGALPSLRAESAMPSLDGTPTPGAAGQGGSFAGALAGQVRQLGALQDQAAQAATGLATGTVTDPEQAVMAVERARLAMQLASQIRTKAVEAAQDVLHTAV